MTALLAPAFTPLRNRPERNHAPMPIWLELLVLLLLTFAGGLALGWALWGRSPARGIEE